MSYITLLVVLVLTLMLTSCAGNSNNPNNEKDYNVTLQCHDVENFYKLERQIPAGEVRKIVKTIEKYRINSEVLKLESEYPYTLTVKSNDNILYKCVMQDTTRFKLQIGNEDSYKDCTIDGLYDLLKRHIDSLEIEFLGTYPVDKMPADMVDLLLRMMIGRVREYLNLDAFPQGEIPMKNVKNNIRDFQKWYAANKDKIKWDEKQNKYIVTE